MKRYINLVKHKKRTTKTYLVGPKQLHRHLGPISCMMQLVCVCLLVWDPWLWAVKGVFGAEGGRREVGVVGGGGGW